MVCRCCGAHDSLRREERRGFLQRRFFPRFGLFPWECKLCRKVRLYPAKSLAKLRESAGSASGSHSSLPSEAVDRSRVRAQAVQED
jgi:hypothetical protein